jgi:hypothetical protein
MIEMESQAVKPARAGEFGLYLEWPLDAPHPPRRPDSP